MGRSVVVAGLDPGPVTVATADALIDAVVRLTRRAGIDPARLFVDTHRVVTRSSDVHTVVTLSAGDVHEWQLWRVCGDALNDHRLRAVAVGRHSVGDTVGIEAARAAIQERIQRIAGRCVYFPGVESLTGTMTVGQIVAKSAIDVVVEVAGDELALDSEVLTGGHVRPRWEFGDLTLHVQHEGQGLHTPFETARPLTSL